MKRKSVSFLLMSAMTLFIVAQTFVLQSCSGKDYTKVEEQVTKAEDFINNLAIDCPELISGAETQYTQGENIKMAFNLNEKYISVENIQPNTFKYFCATLMSENKGKGLDDFVNELNHAETGLEVTLNSGNQSMTYNLTAKEIKKLATTPLSQLGPSSVRNNACLMFDNLGKWMVDSLAKNPSAELKETYSESGFFKVQLYYQKESDFGKLTLPNLKLRAKKYFSEVFRGWGALQPVLFKMFESLPSDGIIVALRAKDGDKFLQTTLPWSELY